MLGRTWLVLFALTALALAACSQGRDYPSNLEDDAYALEAMALTDADIADGMATIGGTQLDNEQWARMFNPADQQELNARLNQLDAQGRVSGFATQYAWYEPNAQSLRDTILPHPGRPHLFTVQSTLYTEEHFAIDSTSTLCGIQANDKDPVEEFKVPKIADQSAGFYSIGQLGDFGKLIETTVCFRTGRIVHAVVQQGLDGTQDIGLSVRLAHKMLKRVNDAFDGKAPPEDSSGAGKKPG